MENSLSTASTATYNHFDYDSDFEYRRNFQRVCMEIHGRFMRENKEEFPCVTQNISVGGVALTTNGESEVGEPVIIYLDDIGRLPAKVVRKFDQGLALQFDISKTRRNKLVDRLTWLVNRNLLVGPENRSFERFAPKNSSIVIQYDDGHQEQANLVDISLSGASLQTNRNIPIGTNITVGKLRAKVVRVHDKGIGVHFLDIQKPAALSPFFKS